MKEFTRLTEQEMLALAVTLEERDVGAYWNGPTFAHES
jgi:hypothetical protein